MQGTIHPYGPRVFVFAIHFALMLSVVMCQSGLFTCGKVPAALRALAVQLLM